MDGESDDVEFLDGIDPDFSMKSDGLESLESARQKYKLQNPVTISWNCKVSECVKVMILYYFEAAVLVLHTCKNVRTLLTKIAC